MVIQIFSAFERNGADLVVAIFMMLAVAAHTVVAVIVAIVNLVRGRGAPPSSWLLCALVVAIIGFGTCAGGAFLAQFYSQPGGL